MSLNEKSNSKYQALTQRWAWIVAATMIMTVAPKQSSGSIIALVGNSSYITPWADDHLGEAGVGSFRPSGLKYDDHPVFVTDGSNLSSTTLNWATDNTGAGPGTYQVFDFAFEQRRDGTLNSLSRIYGAVRFAANQNAAYQLSGLFSLQGAGEISVNVQLYNQTLGYHLFQDFSQSNNVADNPLILNDEEFALGIANDGNDHNSTMGSLSGGMIAGHIYRLSFDVYIERHDPSAAEDATANGFLRLEIGDVPETAVAPEPASLILWGGMGLVGLVAMRRRKVGAALESSSTPSLAQIHPRTRAPNASAPVAG